MSEEIGKHKGALETLLHEKKELSRLLQIVNSQINRHMSALEEKGVDSERYLEQITQGSQTQNRQQRRNRNNDKNASSQRNNKPNERQDREKSGSKRDFNPYG